MKLNKKSNTKSNKKLKEGLSIGLIPTENSPLQWWVVFAIVIILIFYLMWKYEYNSSTSNMMLDMFSSSKQ